jgi:hypothetical protein
MKKYFVLYKASPEEIKKWLSKSSPEDQKKITEAWGKWTGDHKSDIADPGTQLNQVKQVTTKGITDVHNDVGGYMILQAESHDAAAKLLQDSPHFLGGDAFTIEVMDMPEMK